MKSKPRKAFSRCSTVLFNFKWYYYCWLYNLRLQKFERNTGLEDITLPEFDRKKKLIYASWPNGCCNFGSATYAYVAGKPVPIKEEVQKAEDGKVISNVKSVSKASLRWLKKQLKKPRVNKGAFQVFVIAPPLINFSLPHETNALARKSLAAYLVLPTKRSYGTKTTGVNPN